LPPFANSASTFPKLRNTLPDCFTVVSICCLKASDSNAPWAPSFHSIFNCLRPFIAAHVLLAITATPPSGWNRCGGLKVSSATVCCTPFTESAALSSTLFAVPPSTGGCSIDANTMPSR
jgi:hypothetical protein